MRVGLEETKEDLLAKILERTKIIPDIQTKLFSSIKNKSERMKKDLIKKYSIDRFKVQVSTEL